MLFQKIIPSYKIINGGVYTKSYTLRGGGYIENGYVFVCLVDLHIYKCIYKKKYSETKLLNNNVQEDTKY